MTREVDYLITPRLERRVVALEADSPLQVRLVPRVEAPVTLAERMRQIWQTLQRDHFLSGLLVISLVLMIGVVGLWTYFVYPQMVSDIKPGPAGLDFAVKYSPWLAVDDEESFAVTLVNNGAGPLSQVRAYLVFVGPVPISTAADSSNSADFGDLAMGERKTRHIKVVLDRQPGNQVRAELRVTARELGEAVLDTYAFNVAPVHWLKSSIRWVLGSVVLIIPSALALLLRGALKGVLPQG